ncbi:MAG TPA: ABC transporter substrate-binding protein [Candidatus Enterocloster excrementipullorum]|uniref:ABC transporter substrate-binding protein n=1 Tax=Candidatus Enterocloster excrementipullorum TaxID=2838559 RepID=A0A9D2SI13_9FIRM|nr:ABC transporter substrate-binding protein [Candidatus Enterocloster excrementipullorum]
MKKFFRIAAALSLTGLLLSGCSAGGSSDKNLTPLVLNEVAHSIFYAPQYAAIELGYFEEEGIDLTLVNGGGADKVMTALISGDAQIGFMGSEASIYVYQEGSQDYAVNFAQLTQRAGNFLVGREPEPDFTWENLRGKKVLGGRAAGMPQMVFEYILKKHGLDPKTDLSIDQSINFGLTAAAFTSSDADYTVEFEPFATTLELEGSGYVVASLGTESGYVPYTAYCTRKSYMEENPELVQKFTNAIQRGIDYVNSHTSEEIARTIAPQFQETPVEKIALIVERYKAQNTWKEDTVFEQESFDLLQNILEEAGELDERVPYADLVTTEFSEKAK